MADPTPPPGREADRLIYAGLLGVAAACVVQLVEKDTLNLSLLIAAYSFAVSIPLLAVGLITDYARRAGHRIPLSQDFIGAAGALSAVVGLAATFFHLGVAIGITFVIAAFVGVILIRRI